MTERLPALQDVQLEVQTLGLAIDPSELHGALCGWLAGGGSDAANWIGQVMADPELAAEVPGSGMAHLRKATSEQFMDRDFGLELLLAESDASLAARSGSLFAWCRGFLGGLGLAAGAAPALSEESSEALADLARFAAVAPQDDLEDQQEDDQEEEQALAEIEEFVRVAALLLHGDCVLASRHRRSFN